MKRSTPVNRNIGVQVKKYRKLCGLTQEELAAQLQTAGCDMTRVMVGHIEIGRRAVSIYEIDKLCEILQVDYNALLAQATRDAI